VNNDWGYSLILFAVIVGVMVYLWRNR